MRPLQSRVNRRDLLRLRRAGRALARPEIDANADAPGAQDLLRAQRAAMGSYFEVRLGARTPGGVELAERALDLIDTLEAQLTVYRDDSELSRLNATAHLGPVVVEPGLFGLLDHAVRLGAATDGAYDVATGALSEAWGFFRGPKRVPAPETLEDARARTGAHHLRLDPERMTVAFDRSGIVINLGSIGKGCAIDRVVDLVRAHWWPTSALVHGGRSSLYALGSPPGRFGDRWEVALHNPFDSESPLGLIRIRNRGMGTSGASFQRFESGGRVFGHILDPRTGAPADGPASVTVLAPTAAEADALSTAFYLLGRAGTLPYLENHPEIAAIFVEESRAGESPRITTFGLDRDEFERLPAGRSRRTQPTEFTRHV